MRYSMVFLLITSVGVTIAVGLGVSLWLAAGYVVGALAVAADEYHDEWRRGDRPWRGSAR